MKTRAEAAARAVDWAESAHLTYVRAARSHDAARRIAADLPHVAVVSPEAARLSAASAAEYRNAELEVSLATAWAAIAAVLPEDRP